MKNLFNNISQEEKNRILEMHSAKKNVISEQGAIFPSPTPKPSPAPVSIPTPKKITEDMSINLYLEPNQTKQPERHIIEKINLKNDIIEFILDDEDKLSSPKLIFKCGSNDLTMSTFDSSKKVYNKQLLASLKNQFCMKNSQGITVPKADFAMNNQQNDTTTGIA